MPFELEIRGAARIRNFAHILSCAAKLTDVVLLEPSPTRFALRAINHARTTHALLAVDAAGDHFHRYAVAAVPPPAAQGSLASLPGPDPSPRMPTGRGSGVASGEWVDQFYAVSARALTFCVIRNCTATATRLVLSAGFAGGRGGEAVAADAMSATVEFGPHVRKRYSLPLLDRESQRPLVDTAVYGFQCVGDAKVWLNALQSLPSSATRVGVHPAAHRVRLLASDPGARLAVAAVGVSKATSGVAVSIDPRQFAGGMVFNPHDGHRDHDTGHILRLTKTPQRYLGQSLLAQGGHKCIGHRSSYQPRRHCIHTRKRCEIA